MSGGDARPQNVDTSDQGDAPSVKDIREGKTDQPPHAQTQEQGSGDKTPPRKKGDS